MISFCYAESNSLFSGTNNWSARLLYGGFQHSLGEKPLGIYGLGASKVCGQALTSMGLQGAL